MTDKKPTDAEIVKALECCKCGTLNDCDGCPCFSDEDINTARECAENLMSNALDLINRLQADVDNYKQIAENQQKIILDKAFENKRLRTSNDALRMANELCKGWEERAKAEAYKEFAENNFGGCKGCINIGFRYPYASMYPCNNCIRADMKDYYEAKELVGEDNG